MLCKKTAVLPLPCAQIQDVAGRRKILYRCLGKERRFVYPIGILVVGSVFLLPVIVLIGRHIFEVILAERGGFEPPVELPLHHLSKMAH